MHCEAGRTEAFHKAQHLAAAMQKSTVPNTASTPCIPSETQATEPPHLPKVHD